MGEWSIAYGPAQDLTARPADSIARPDIVISGIEDSVSSPEDLVARSANSIAGARDYHFR